MQPGPSAGKQLTSSNTEKHVTNKNSGKRVAITKPRKTRNEYQARENMQLTTAKRAPCKRYQEQENM